MDFWITTQTVLFFFLLTFFENVHVCSVRFTACFSECYCYPSGVSLPDVAYIRGEVSGGGRTIGDIEDENIVLLFERAHFGIFAMLC